MPIKLPVGWVIALNVLGWPVIHLVVAYLFTHMPDAAFDPRSPLFRARNWERQRGGYERIFGVKNWKSLLPDGAPWLRGFSKKRLTTRDLGYLGQFARETCRAEMAHWVMMLAGVVFLLWNPLWADAVMAAYAIAANLPCIVAQRFNRVRLFRVLKHSH